MKKSIFAIVIGLLGTLYFSAVAAKTFTYEITDLTSSNGSVNFPGLDLNIATSAKLTITQPSQFEPATITSLTVNFLSAKPLIARNFSSFNSPYKASVNNLWVYRKVNVDLNGFDINNPEEQFINIDAFVADASGFINDDQGNNFNSLFFASGRLVDVTPSKVVDNKVLTVSGDRLRLSLRDGLKKRADTGPEYQFVINSVWFGNGSENLYLPSGAPFDVARFLTPYRINLTTISGPSGEEQFISVSSRDENGGEFESPPFPLQDLLNQFYPASS